MSAGESGAIRAFVAVELSDEVKVRIAAAIEQLRSEQINNLRLARPEGVHLTLKFLGDIDADRVPAVAEAMSQVAARRTPFGLMLGAPGMFPNASRARVLWIGVDGDLEPLRLLQAGIEDALTSIGFPAEKRRFNPHLTIGRMRHRASRSDRSRAATALSSLRLPEDQPIAGNAISLMKSALRPDGAIYERIAYACLSP